MFYERRKSYIAYNQLFIDILHFFCSNFNLHQVSR
jgi:recombination protein RecA